MNRLDDLDLEAISEGNASTISRFKQYAMKIRDARKRRDAGEIRRIRSDIQIDYLITSVQPVTDVLLEACESCLAEL